MGILHEDVVVINQAEKAGEPTVITVNCPDKTGLGCDLCRVILLFGLSICRGGFREVGSEKKNGIKRNEMVRGSIKLLKDAGSGLSKTLSEILVCPLSKQPLRFCEETNSLISDSIGVSFPIKDGIPCLVPTDGKALDLEADDTIKPEDAVTSSVEHEADRGGSH